MQNIQQHIKRFLLSNTLWIYITLLFFISYLLTITIVHNHLSNYLFYGISLAVLYLPVLLFAFFRTSLERHLSLVLLGIIWLCCFVLYPYGLFFLKDAFFESLFPIDAYFHKNEDIQAFTHAFLLTTNLAILATEIAILLNNYFIQWLREKEWTKRLNTEYFLLLSLALLAVFITGLMLWRYKDFSIGLNLFLAMLYLIYYSVQVFLMLLAYYSFYYINRYYLIPLVLKSKGAIYYGFAFAGTILFLYPVFVFLFRYLPFVQDFELSNYTGFANALAGDSGSLPFFIMFLSVPIIVSLQWFQQNSQISLLEKEKSETELNLLKQQINPHFFFNTLNNLYALSITKDKQTPEVILQLSELMRYVIYKGKEDFVPLEEEVKYIEDYIQLQQIRLHKNLDFTFEKNIENGMQAVPPLLFITFVENAFKHGIEPAENACFLHLKLTSTAEGLEFSCQNSMEANNGNPPGIGLTNLRKRLTLRYPQNHEISISEKENTFFASLQIQTKS